MRLFYPPAPRVAIVASLAGLAMPGAAEVRPIVIDGVAADWAEVAPAYTDPAGDDGPSGVDFGRVWLADDERFLFVRLEVGTEVNLSDDNDLRMYLDTDANSGTGLAVGGIGAELEWRFGSRTGFYRRGGTTQVFHDDIRFRAGPGVTASEFEMAFGRDVEPDGSNPLFFGSDIRVVVRDFSTGDQLPQTGDTVSYTMDVGSQPDDLDIPLSREDADDVRLATFNVGGDGLWNGSAQPRFQRLISAADPDILLFQEINGHSAAETASLIEGWLGGDWHALRHDDVVTVSRYPISDSWTLDGNLVVLLATAPALGSDMLIINAHLPCCTNDSGREGEIDLILAFLREATTSGGGVTIDEGTPVVVGGDLNLVGQSSQLNSLLTGDVIDEAFFGPDFDPDWDGSPLTNLIATQTEKRMAYTWRSDSSSFWPGHLDYFIYSDSVLEIGRSFILYTPEMSSSNLTAHGLLSSDSLVTQHLLFAADVRLPGPGADVNGDGSVDVDDLVAVILAWGDCPDPPKPCPADVDGNGVVDVDDLVAVILNWDA